MRQAKALLVACAEAGIESFYVAGRRIALREVGAGQHTCSTSAKVSTSLRGSIWCA
jgi:hypothetical protein